MAKVAVFAPPPGLQSPFAPIVFPTSVTSGIVFSRRLARYFSMLNYYLRDLKTIFYETFAEGSIWN